MQMELPISLSLSRSLFASLSEAIWIFQRKTAARWRESHIRHSVFCTRRLIYIWNESARCLRVCKMSRLPLAHERRHKQRKIIHAAGVASCAQANCVFNINEVETCNYSGQSAAGTGACFLNTRALAELLLREMWCARCWCCGEQFSRRGRTFDL